MLTEAALLIGYVVVDRVRVGRDTIIEKVDGIRNLETVASLAPGGSAHEVRRNHDLHAFR